MSIAEIVRYLKCLRCGTRENLTIYAYSKRYKYKTGGPPVYTVHRGTNSLKTPICYDCLHKIKRWKLYFYLTIGLLILVEVIFYLVFSIIVPFFLQYYMGLGVFFGLIFASIIIFLLANLNNPRSFVKFTGHTPYVRPIKSNKWVTFKNWSEITIRGDEIQPIIKEPINPLVWKFPLIGGIICLAAIITPTQILLYNDGRLMIEWMPLITFINEVEVWDYVIGHQFIPIFPFHFTSLFMSPTTFLSIVTYIVALVSAFIFINKAYLLKRAGHSIKSINNMHLVFGIILIIFVSVFYFLNVRVTNSTATSILGPGIYGVFVGGFITLLGPIIQSIRKLR